MTNFFKRTSQIQIIIALRSIAITIQLLLILFVNLGLTYQLPWMPLVSVISLEILFTLSSYIYYRHNNLTENKASQKAILTQICADIIFLSLLLFFSGGATNAFVSLLLIPIAIAAVTLTPLLLAVVAFLAIGSYSILLWSLPMSVMQGHFIGMGINFLFSTMVVAIVVGKMARNINQQELAIAAYRENLLKQEQVTALGVASAQVTHQLATPIATVQLLADELSEDLPDNNIVVEIQNQLARCRTSLSDFHAMVFDIKEQVNNPEIHLNFLKSSEQKSAKDITINTDAALLPAIINWINNAIRASTMATYHSLQQVLKANQGNISVTARRVFHA